MARVTIQDSGTVHTSDAEVAAFLKPYGIDFERWDLTGIPRELLDKSALTPEEKQRILDALAAPIEVAKKKFNYQSADVVALWPDLPNLDGIMQPFQKEHFHTENEIRLCIDGAGIFSINPRDASVFHIEMQPGELISVPAGTWHWFNLTDAKRIKAVRVFESMEGWAAIYPEPARATDEAIAI